MGRFRRASIGLLCLGIALRITVHLTALSYNPDRHFEIIRFLYDHHALPTSNTLDQAYQPPLYYLLMWPLYALRESFVLVHFASLAMSCGNLLLIRRLMSDPTVRTLVPSATARLAAFALMAALPEFVVFSSFISNDSLSFLVGTLIVWASLSYAGSPERRALLTLAGLVGVGLLTKGTFLLIGPALAVVVAAVEWRRRGLKHAAIATLVFCAIFTTVGAYKFVENTVRLGRPIVHNQDVVSPTALMQRGVWKGWQTAVDINVIPLIRQPVILRDHLPSYPQLLYATFWYAYLPEWSYKGNLQGYDRIGSITYAVAIVPTLTFVLGMFVAARRACRGLDDSGGRALALLLAILLANVAVVLAAGVKYDNWSCFQSRLCFGSIVPIAVLFEMGLETLRRWRFAFSVAMTFGWLSFGCALLYFAVEFALHFNLLDKSPPVEVW